MFHRKGARRSIVIEALSDPVIVAVQLANEQGGARAPSTACQTKVRRGHDIDKMVIDDGGATAAAGVDTGLSHDGPGVHVELQLTGGGVKHINVRHSRSLHMEYEWGRFGACKAGWLEPI